MSWSTNDWIVRREVLASGPWEGMLVRAIEDSPEHLISYTPEGSSFGFPPGDWPTTSGKHPWSDRGSWQGHGCLMIQRPDVGHAIWHFWGGPERKFLCWYINLQEPFRRTAIGYDTQDLELDIIVYPNGKWQLKDDELMEQRILDGRWNAEQVAEIRNEARKLTDRLDSGERWWPLEWQHWQPDPQWQVPRALPAGWEFD